VAEKGSSNRNFYFEGGSKISVYFSFIFTCLLGQSKWLIATPKKQKKTNLGNQHHVWNQKRKLGPLVKEKQNIIPQLKQPLEVHKGRIPSFVFIIACGPCVLACT